MRWVLLGELIDGRYRILRELGRGGMGQVYLALDELLEREVAVKVLIPGTDSEESVDRFRREARSAAALSHPNIVFVHDFGQTPDGRHYLVMEYVPGGTLEDLIKRGPVDSDLAVEIIYQVARALQAAHSRGTVHRDVKPQNVLISDSGEVKVTDFGIARVAASTTMTASGIVMGTPHYVSPEQVNGEPVSPRSDLYSLGVVLYQMLTGRVPYDAQTPVSVAAQHLHGRLRAPSEIEPGIPPELEDLTMRLMARRPEYRPRDATELLRELDGLRAGRDGSRSHMAAGAPAAPVAGQTERTAAYTGDPRSGSSRSGRGVYLAGVAVLMVLVLAALGFGALGSFGNPLAVSGEEGENAPTALTDEPPDSAAPQPDSSPETGSAERPEETPPADTPTGDTPEDTSDGGASPEERFFSRYYAAADREDWSATYGMLDRESRGFFSEAEWYEVQDRREADAPIPPIVSVGIENASAGSAPFTSDVVLEHADGNRQVISEVEVVVEGGEIKRRLKPDEREYLLNLELAGEDGAPSLAVEDTIRSHYEAIGTRDFETAYSYFGPTMRDISPEDRWIEDEESYEIERATVDSVEVTAVGERSATAEVRVRFEDNTGTPSFFLRWTLVMEGGEWKLDRVEEV